MKTRRLVLLVCLLTSIAMWAACNSGSSSDDPDAGAGAEADADLTGAPDADVGGTPDAMVGGVTLQIACTNVCQKGDQCFGGAGQECPAECMADLSGKCSQQEVNQLDGCASIAGCTEFEDCLFAVPCVGGGEDSCGDGLCDGGESCATCPSDCGACVCGDGTCSAGECSSCPADCPNGCACNDTCEVGPAQDPSCGQCQADICAQDPFCCEQSWDDICVGEAETICGQDCPSVCGDFNCEPDEDVTTCPNDCANICGNGLCEDFESCSNCPGDCGACVCGDGTCNLGECSTCAADCPDGCTCGDACVTGPAQDPSCGQCQADICAADPFCCEQSWDSICAGEAESICGKDCPSFCGDFVCDPDEDAASCPNDCGGLMPPPNP